MAYIDIMAFMVGVFTSWLLIKLKGGDDEDSGSGGPSCRA